MDQDPFRQACDRLSREVDARQFERLRWARDEAPKLARMVELALAAVAERPDFELTEEGSTQKVKRFILKVHGQRIVRIDMTLAGEGVEVSAVEIDRSRWRLSDASKLVSSYAKVDETWMAAVLEELIGRVYLPPKPPVSADKAPSGVQPAAASPQARPQRPYV